MIKKISVYILLSIYISLYSIYIPYISISTAYAQEISVIPTDTQASKTQAAINSLNHLYSVTDTTTNGTTTKVVSRDKDFRYTYNQSAEGLELGGQLSSGIMNRDTILAYGVYIVDLVMQLSMVIGAGFIMLAGYKYTMYVWTGKEAEGDLSKIIKNLVIGVFVMAFAYGIIKLLNITFLS